MDPFVKGLIIGGIALGGAGLAAIVKLLERKHRANCVAGREELDDGTIYRRYFVHSGLSQAEAIGAWHHVARALHVRPGLLRADDELSRLRDIPWLGSFPDSNDLDNLEWDILDRSPNIAEWTTMATVRDIVTFIVAFGRAGPSRASNDEASE